MVLLTHADHFAQDLDVEAVALRLGVDLLLALGQLFDLLVDVLDALHDRSKLIACKVTRSAHGLLPVNTTAQKSMIQVAASRQARGLGKRLVKLEPSRAQEADDLLRQRAGRFLGHIVTTSIEHAAAHVGCDQAHRLDEAHTDAGLGAEGQHRDGELALGACAALRQPLGAEIVPIVGEGSAARARRRVHPHIFVEVGRRDRPRADRLGPEQPGEKLALAVTQQQLRQIVEAVEGEMPSLHIRLR